ncbi:MAG: hypothetical protein AAF389_16525 [Gemmatimonadota bacterium]
MTRVTEADVERIAELAHVRLERGERERLTHDMNQILAHADALRDATPDTAEAEERDEADEAAADFGGVRPSEAERPDRLAETPDVWAPKMADGFFVVPPPPAVTGGEGDGS